MAEGSDTTIAVSAVGPLVRQFLETAPLLKRLEFALEQPDYISSVVQRMPERIALPCRSCKALETTTWARSELIYKKDASSEDAVHYDHTFACVDCLHTRATFWLVLEALDARTESSPPSMSGHAKPNSGRRVASRFSLRKIGQYPPWNHPISKRLEKALGANASLLRRGLSNLGEGYGIGAAAYFRRVVENEVDDLLSLIEEAAELDGDEAARMNVAEARKSHTASDRLKLAAQVIPATLRPGGVNPLGILYGHLSAPLHSESEEEAILTAESILTTFTFLFENLKEGLDRKRDYAASVQRLAAGKKQD